MPYAPGVVNNSGQILAQGISGAVDDISNGYKTFQQNNLLAQQAMAKFSGIAQANPDMVAYLAHDQANPELGSIYGKLTKGGAVGFKDAAALATFADSFVGAKQKKQEQDYNQARMDELAQAQNQRRVQAVQAQKDDAAFQGAMAGDKTNILPSYLKAGGSISGLKNLGFDVDKMLAPNGGDKPQPQLVNLPGGTRVAFSPGTGAISVLPQTPEELGRAKAAETEATEGAKSAVANLSEITDAAESARHTIGSIDRIVQLYQGGAQSGFGQSTLTQARAALSRFGLAKDGIANQQQLEQELGNLVLQQTKETAKGQGSMSNYERELFQKAAANKTNAMESNLQILGVLRNVKDRSVKLDDLRTKLEDEGKSSVEISHALRKAMASMPVGIDNLIPMAHELPAGWKIGP